MNESWVSDAVAYVDELVSALSARVDQRTLGSGRILEFVITAAAPGAAEVSLIVSPYEVILGAGRGTRFELGPLPESSVEVRRIVEAIARGGLTEHLSPRSVRFELVLEDGARVSGRSGGSGIRNPERQVVHYAAFAGS